MEDFHGHYYEIYFSKIIIFNIKPFYKGMV